jgi:hypothetical protein
MKVVQGPNSINCANKVWPTYMAVSRRKPRSLGRRAIQVDTTLFRPESRRTPGAPGHVPSVNRTAVIDHISRGHTMQECLGWIVGEKISQRKVYVKTIGRIT